MYKYILYLVFEKSGEFKTFQEAFEKLYREVHKQAEKGQPPAILMPTNYITFDYSDTNLGVYFNRSMAVEDARDFAYKMGYLSREGELVKPEKEIPETDVIKEFRRF